MANFKRSPITQAQVMGLKKEGLTYAQICEKLQCSRGVINSRIREIALDGGGGVVKTKIAQNKKCTCCKIRRVAPNLRNLCTRCFKQGPIGNELC